ncbi:MAG: LysM peptidoglycan-binding domain-containing protein, partial [Anaerolineales bacterium]
GERPHQRALAAGYPLAGDLSQGGFFSENIIGGSGLSPQAAVQAWQGDAPHLNTMLSPNLQEIGAGVAVRDGYYYYVIDCARPTSSGMPQPYTAGPGLPARGTFSPREYMMPVFTVTPQADGRVIHIVQSGQTLWSIAIAYGVKVDDLRRLNNLVGNTIYPGQKLFITRLPTATSTLPPPTPSSTPWPTRTLSPTSTPTLVPSPMPTPITAREVFNQGWLVVVTVFVLLALAVLVTLGFSGRGEKLVSK